MTNEEILASATQKREDKEDEENGIDIFDDPAVKPSRTFAVSNIFAGPVGVPNSGCPLFLA